MTAFTLIENTRIGSGLLRASQSMQKGVLLGLMWLGQTITVSRVSLSVTLNASNAGLSCLLAQRASAKLNEANYGGMVNYTVSACVAIATFSILGRMIIKAQIAAIRASILADYISIAITQAEIAKIRAFPNLQLANFVQLRNVINNQSLTIENRAVQAEALMNQLEQMRVHLTSVEWGEARSKGIAEYQTRAPLA